MARRKPNVLHTYGPYPVSGDVVGLTADADRDRWVVEAVVRLECFEGCGLMLERLPDVDSWVLRREDDRLLLEIWRDGDGVFHLIYYSAKEIDPCWWMSRLNLLL